MMEPRGHDGFAEPLPRRYAMAAAQEQRIPPHNLEAERGVLGSMLIDSAVIDEVMPFLRPTHFYREIHMLLCFAIYQLRNEGKPVDTITVEERLSQLGEIERIGGVETIFGIVEAVPVSANGRYWAQIVYEKSVARDLIQAHTTGLTRAYGNAHSAEDLVKLAEDDLFGVTDSRFTNVSSTAVQAADVALQLIEDRRQGLAIGVDFGILALDALIGGAMPGQLHIVGARPSMGKTAWGLQIAMGVAATYGKPVLFFSLEMQVSEVGDRMLAWISQVDGQRIRHSGRLTEEDRDRLADARKSLLSMPLEIDDTPALTPGQIAAHGRRIKSRQGDIGLIVVDYLGLVTPDGGRDSNRQEQVAGIVRRLKTLSRELGCPVVALSQLNRLLEHREDKRPRMADLRESGAAEQDAHTVTLIHRPEYYDPYDRPGTAELILAKNRSGPTGTILARFDRSTTRFSDHD